MRKFFKTGLACFCFVMMLGFTAQAGTEFADFNTTVGKFNGSGYTGTQRKAYSGANGYVSTSSVGGGYSVDARMVSGNIKGGWTRGISGNCGQELPGNSQQKKGKNVRVQFSNNITTPVNVQVTGRWKSN